MIAVATARKKAAIVQKYVENCLLLEERKVTPPPTNLLCSSNTPRL